MESSQEIHAAKPQGGFFNHMFNLKKTEKAQVYNILQYSVLALLPLMVLIRVNQNLWPKADEAKGSIELLAEMMGEVAVTSLIVFVVFRFIDYIPTFSGEPLHCINILTVITAVIISLPWYDKDSNIGSKAKALHKRINENLPSWLRVTMDNQSDPRKKLQARRKNGLNTPRAPGHQPSRADPILPPPKVSVRADEPLRDFANIYQSNSPQYGNAGGSTTGGFSNDPLKDVRQEGFGIGAGISGGMSGGLMAANEVLGGGFGGSPW